MSFDILESINQLKSRADSMSEMVREIHSSKKGGGTYLGSILPNNPFISSGHNEVIQAHMDWMWSELEDCAFNMVANLLHQRYSLAELNREKLALSNLYNEPNNVANNREERIARQIDLIKGIEDGIIRINTELHHFIVDAMYAAFVNCMMKQSPEESALAFKNGVQAYCKGDVVLTSDIWKAQGNPKMYVPIVITIAKTKQNKKNGIMYESKITFYIDEHGNVKHHLSDYTKGKFASQELCEDMHKYVNAVYRILDMAANGDQAMMPSNNSNYAGRVNKSGEKPDSSNIMSTINSYNAKYAKNRIAYNG